MALHRMRKVTACLILAFCFSRAAWGTGGWDEEEPTTLDESLSSLPAKSLGQIFFETSPKPADVPAPDYAAEIAKISARIGKDKPDDLAKEVDGLLEKARLNYEDGDWCNFLQDMRDVVSSSAGKDAAAEQQYIKWRLDNKGWFGFQPKPQDNGDDADTTQKKPDAADPRQAELDRLTNAATGPIMAHWLYLRGALLYAGGDRSDCKDWFARVVKEFPDSPRAEFAQFMIARCDLSISRNMDYNAPPEKVQVASAKAKEEFEAFRRKYPNGRLDTDALGWLGGIAFKDGDSLAALQYFITQAEDAKHPEVRKSAVFMCEDTLANLKPDADNSPVYALLARHPQVAMAYIYQVVNVGATATDDAADAPVDTAKIKKWRTNVLPLVSAEVAKQHDLYKAGDWQPRYLAMLAQAACDAGDPAKALQITGVAVEQINGSDDLLLARALALQQAKRPGDAIETYRELVKRFPDGALTNGARLRLALALQDDHQAGAAIVELRALRAVKDISGEQSTTGFLYPSSYTDLTPTDSGIDPNISGVYVEQIDQVIDTLLNFAPVPELAAALDSPALDAAAKSELRAVLAERCLVAEDFAGAKKYMTPAQYGLIAANLEKLTQEANGARDAKDRAVKFAQVGDAWAQARNRLLRMPLGDSRGTIAISGSPDPYYNMPREPERRTNGTALRFTNVDTELEDRDELRHASRWWMRAARENPGTPVAASARWKALEAMPVIASASIYAETRAREIHFDKVSREIYDKLRTECPDSVEAKRYAAYWSLPGPQKDEQGNEVKIWDAGPYGDGGDNSDINQIGYEFSDYGAFNVSSQISNWEGQNDGTWQEIAARIGKLHDHAQKWDVTHMGKEIDELAGMARDNCSSIEELTTLNFLDDMALFTREKGVTPEMLRAYLDIRLGVLGRSNWPGSPMAPDNGGNDDDSGNTTGISPRDEAVADKIDKALKDPAMKPIADYLECARIGMVAAEQTQAKTDETDYKADSEEGDSNGGPGHYTYQSRDFAKMEKLCREFLKKYPASRKREAVAFVLARSVVSLSKPHITYVGKPAPGTNIKDANFEEVKKVLRAEPFSAKRVNEALDVYDHEFPKGRYSADIRDYRAYVAWQTRDWGKALDLTLAELDDNSDAILQGEAALRLANIFAALKETPERPDLMDAIRQRPAAKERLRQYVAAVAKDMSHPLRYMQAYLTDQFPAAGK